MCDSGRQQVTTRRIAELERRSEFNNAINGVLIHCEIGLSTIAHVHVSGQFSGGIKREATIIYPSVFHFI